ncbi:hypothetical protein [Rhodopirellula bahusiensis]|nr:hypothetical protein [Rhodopirellula bahusiensis]
MMSAEPNPYSVGETTDNLSEEPRTFFGNVLVFIRVVVFSILWMFVFFFGSAMIVGFLAGTYFVFLALQSADPSEPSLWIGTGTVVISEGMGLLGLMLGLLGKLPGTRR